MTDDILNLMRLSPGLYIFGDAEMPGVSFPVVVIKPHKDLPGQIFALEPRYEVEASPAGFKDSVYLAGGPISVQQLETESEREFEQKGVECEADYFKDIALRAEKHLRFARTMLAPKSAGFIEADELIDRIESYRRAHATLEESFFNNPPQAA